MEMNEKLHQIFEELRNVEFSEFDKSLDEKNVSLEEEEFRIAIYNFFLKQKKIIGDSSMNKEEAWNYALGMIKVDGLTPSEEFLTLIEAEKKGEIVDQDILNRLNEKYGKYREKELVYNGN